MSKGLVPEKRVNKLGHLVTKYVKSKWFGAKEVAPLPAPVMQPLPVAVKSDEDKQLAMDIAERVARTLKSSSSQTPANMKHFIAMSYMKTSTLNPATLRLFNEVDDDGAALVMEMIHYGMTDSAANNLLALYAMDNGWLNTSKSDIPFFEGLRFYDDLTPVLEDGTHPQERVEQCNALLTVSLHINENGDDQYRTNFDGGEVQDGSKDNFVEYTYIKKKPLVDLLLDPSKRDATVRIVMERDIYDAEQITELISTGHRTLSDGAL